MPWSPEINKSAAWTSGATGSAGVSTGDPDGGAGGAGYARLGSWLLDVAGESMPMEAYPEKVQMIIPPPQLIGGYAVVGEKRRCRVCGEKTKKICSNCKDVKVKQYYCGEKCQKKDWLCHRVVCRHRIMITS